MHTHNMEFRVLALLLLTTLAAAASQRGMMGGPGMGMGMGGDMMGGHGMMGGHRMMDSTMGDSGNGMQCPGRVFMSLLSQHDKIQRQVKDTDKGIESLTESNDPAVAALIKTHVQQMQALLDSCAKGECSHTPRYFDPLFRAVYSNADKLHLKFAHTDKGVQVVETGTTEAAKLLVQAHAAVVSTFVKSGFEEHHKTHEVPTAAAAVVAGAQHLAVGMNQPLN